jgi:hypothetical protein
MQPYINDAIDPSDRWYYYRISKNELYRYLDNHAQLVSVPDNIYYYGSPVQVYRLTWTP